jgi:N-acetylglutamate synthase-like GNAT family acetyltransferase
MIQRLNTIRKALPADFQAILQLLNANGLPTIGVQRHLQQYLVWAVITKDSTESHIRGCVGLELYGKDALLRSLSVNPKYQGKSIGTQLLRSIITQAKENKIKNLFLLTTTAEFYFKRHQFTRVNRVDVPTDIKESVEFRSACPSSAICMMKKLDM